MPDTIRLSKSVLGEAEKQAVMGVLNREYLGMGGEVQEFENLLSQFFNRPTICVNTGTAALHLALQALGLGHGDEVLVQSLTYIASFQAISATGAKPVPCEVNPETITLDVTDAQKRLTNRTKVIMPVHYAGGMGNLDEIYEFAKDNRLRVVEDACHAFGGDYKGKNVGSFGDIACFSFDGIKNITAGEGGAIVTDDKAVLQKVRNARLLGVEKDTEKRFIGELSWDFDVRYQGWRYHMSNIMAAIGKEQFKRLSEFASRRRQLAKRYRNNLKSVNSIELINQDLDSIVPHIFVIKLKLGNREKIRKGLLERSIETGAHYQPNHFLSMYNHDGNISLPVTEKIFPKLLSLPLHPDLKGSDVDYICEQLVDVLIHET
ncbi:DegT/DnrJ/EryC1/StrS family aminotransferase [Candidatus Pacearchaeota archaeon]|nr:DegT/DnrJ/EryC1/StrS family aminotransferase [Candidatus Pacearchaeota archaeon]